MFIPSVQTVWWQGFASIYEVPFSCLTVGVGGHSCEISSMSCHRVARLIKVGRNCCCGVCVEWIVCCLSMLFKAFTKSAFSLTYILFLFLFVFVLFCRSANLAFSFVLFHTSRDVSLIRDPAKGTNQFCLRVAWTSAFKQFIFPYYSVTCWSVEQRNLFDCKKKDDLLVRFSGWSNYISSPLLQGSHEIALRVRTSTLNASRRRLAVRFLAAHNFNNFRFFFSLTSLSIAFFQRKKILLPHHERWEHGQVKCEYRTQDRNNSPDMATVFPGFQSALTQLLTVLNF